MHQSFLVLATGEAGQNKVTDLGEVDVADGPNPLEDLSYFDGIYMSRYIVLRNYRGDMAFKWFFAA